MKSLPFSRAAAAALPVAAAALLGQAATTPNLSWYDGLKKPAFTPPKHLFGPVWAGLYGLIAASAWRILGLERETPRRRSALALLYAQLALNAVWPYMFFARRSPRAGVANIVPQWLVIMAAIERLRRLDAAAAACLVPLAGWVAYAALLNIEISRRNDQESL